MSVIPFPSHRRAEGASPEEPGRPEPVLDPEAVSLVQTPKLDPSQLPAALRRHLRAVQSVADRALAASTDRSYRAKWGRFVEWCTTNGLSPMPADPATLSLFIIEHVAVLDRNGEIVFGAGGEPERGEWRPVTAEIALTAIDRVHLAQDYPAPSAHPEVRNVMAGVRRTWGMATLDAREPLLLDDISKMLAALAANDPLVTGRCAIALRDAGLSYSDLANLTWEDITRSEAAPAALTITRRSRQHTVELDAVTWAALHVMERDGASGPVFGMTRQGCEQLVKRTQRRDRSFGCTAGTARDRALLLLGFFSALRRTNLADLRWDDLRIWRDGIEIRVRWSKTDQERRGDTIWVPRGTEKDLCPVEAVETWARHASHAVGHEVLGTGEHLFLRVTAAGDILSRESAGKPLGGRAIAEAIRRAAQLAGIDPERIGAHSLRAGFVTEALSSGSEIAAVRDVTLHKSTDVLMGYYRQADKRRNSAVANILSQAAARQPLR